MSTIAKQPIESHRIVRERLFSSDELVRTLALLRTERATGTLRIEYNQGGIRAIYFREESHVLPEFEK